MISGVLVFNSNAELVISRFYKSDYSRVAAEAFRVKVVAAKNFNSPVILMERSSFMFVRQDDLVVAAVTKKNANANLVFTFLYELISVFKAYFEGEFNEQAIRSNFVLVYELFDEVMDWGYPQIVNTDLLKTYIHHGVADDKYQSKTMVEQQRETREITSAITGTCPWRQEGKYHYAKNEVYLDVIEDVNVIIAKSGQILSSFCKGKIRMKSSLSGMPICRFGLNDKVSMQKRREARGSKKRVESKHSINLEDVTFHRCVKLNRYDQDKTIMFTPPDGEYELMTYRINKTNLPFDCRGIVNEFGRNRVDYNVSVKSKYENYNVANDITVNIPVPGHTNKVDMKVTVGKWKYNPSKSVIEWSVPKLQGEQTIRLKGTVTLTHLIQDKAWARPPISMSFTIPMWPASGLKVRFLNVQEPKMNYKSIKWVRYITHGGDYQIRI